MPQSSSTVLDRAACLALLATRSLGRLVYTHRALPDVLPVNYRLVGENVLIRLAIGSAAAAATRDAVVAFEADDLDPQSLAGWSVTIVGRAHEITDPDERIDAGAGAMAGAFAGTTAGSIAGTTAGSTTGSLAGSMAGSMGGDVDGHSAYFSVAAEKISGRRLIAVSQGLELPRGLALRVESESEGPDRAGTAA